MEKKPTSGLAVAALVLGIIGLVTSVIPVVNNMSFFMGIIGLIFAIIGLVGIGKGKKGGKGLAIGGLVTSILAIVVTLAAQSAFVAALDAATSSSPSASSSASQSASASSSSNGSSADASAAGNGASADSTASDDASDGASQEAAAEAAAAPDAPYTVTIDGADMGTDYQGEKAVIVTYTFTNNSDDARNFMTTMSAQAFQDGVELENAIMVDGVDSQDLMKDIKPGKSITVKQAYVLADTKNDVTVEVSELWDFSNELIAEATFAVK